MSLAKGFLGLILGDVFSKKNSLLRKLSRSEDSLAYARSNISSRMARLGPSGTLC